jgi:hypothetical protein
MRCRAIVNQADSVLIRLTFPALKSTPMRLGMAEKISSGFATLLQNLIKPTLST